MAQRNSSGRGGTATRTKRQTGNRTPNTPQISESEISRMRVDDIRGQLRRYGVSGISALRKPELVKTLVKTMRSGGAARRSTGPAGRASATKAAGTTQAAGRTGTGRTAPGRAKAAPASRAVSARKAAGGTARKTTTSAARKTATGAARKTTTSAARKTAAGTARKTTTSAARKTTTSAARKTAAGAGARKTAPRKAAPAAKSTAARKTTAARKSTAGGATARKAGTTARKSTASRAAPARGAAKAAPAGGGVRTGRGTARSSRSSQVIASIQDQPERPGRSLVTTNHDVIQRWARDRGAKPATISGTEREGRAGVLTFNIPGYRESSRIREITWDEWFYTFDLRRLNLIYQEQMRDGRQSNFFRTESPDREDA